LLDPNLNKTIVAWRKRGNTEFSETMKAIASQRDEEYHCVQKKGCQERDNTYQARSNADPEVQAKISRAMTGRKKTAEHNAKVAIRNKERSKPIHTPYGNFESRKAAVEHMNTIMGNASRKLDNWLKTKPTEFYYV